MTPHIDNTSTPLTWSDLRLYEPEVEAWLDAGWTPKTAETWAVMDRVDLKYPVTYLSPTHAAEWNSAGFTPRQAHICVLEWVITLRDAVMWRDAGYDTDSLHLLHEKAGVTGEPEWETVRPFAHLGLPIAVLVDTVRPALKVLRAARGDQEHYDPRHPDFQDVRTDFDKGARFERRQEHCDPRQPVHHDVQTYLGGDDPPF